MTLKDELKAWSLDHGADTFGIASAATFEAKVPNQQKPSETAAGMNSLIAFTIHMLNGSMASHDVVTQSINSHVCIDIIEKLQYEMCDWLEDRGPIKDGAANGLLTSPGQSFEGPFEDEPAPAPSFSRLNLRALAWIVAPDLVAAPP